MMSAAARARVSWEDEHADLLRVKTVEDVMTSNVYTVTPDWDLLSTVRLLRRHHISGVPVVDDRDHVVGVVSELDVVEGLNEAAGVAKPRGLLDLLLAAAKVGRNDLLEQTIHYLRHTKVSSVMAHKPVSVGPDESLGEAARLFRQYQIQRLPVVRDGVLMGIVTREDIIRALVPESVVVKRSAAGRRFARGPSSR